MIHYGLTDKEALYLLTAQRALAYAFAEVRPTDRLMDSLYQILARLGA